MKPAWDLREVREGVERGESEADPWSQWLPARQIWVGKGIQSLYKGRRVLQSIYFPCGLRNIFVWLKKIFIGVVMYVMKRSRAPAPRLRAHGAVIYVHKSPSLFHHLA